MVQISLIIYLLFEPDQISRCFIYIKSPPSIIHLVLCSCISGCGFIAIATMQQIRRSLKVILGDITPAQAQRQIKMFNAVSIGLWSLDQIGTLVLLFFFDKAKRGLILQSLGLAIVISIYAY